MLATPRSPLPQSPGGMLNRAWVRPSPSSRLRSSAAGCSYGNRNSTPSKRALRAAAKRSRNGTSLNIMDRLAASRGIADPPRKCGGRLQAGGGIDQRMTAERLLLALLLGGIGVGCVLVLYPFFSAVLW